MVPGVLLATCENLYNVGVQFILMADLKTCRYPYVENTKIDCSDKHSGRDHNLSRVSAVGYNDTDTIDDDLQQ